MPRRVTVEVPAGAAGSRADRFMADASGLSRAMVQKLIAEGLLTADGRPMRARDPVTPGAIMQLDVPDPRPETEMLPEDIPLEVVYQDHDILIVNKPSGLVTHPAPGHPTGTLVNALLALDADDGLGLGTIAGIERPGIVHRLDRDTSGLLMVARNDAAQVGLQAQLKARRIHKRYLALVAGAVTAQIGRIEAPIGRDPRHRQRMAVVPDGRPSITGYRVRERFREWTLVECDLVTGRTHQIRVHFASIGHPVAGDPIYATGTARTGPHGLERLFLHAWRLELVSPVSGELVRAEAPVPDELESVLGLLRSREERGD
jgi:23S rRNA pseudouridine1911/1915/1917 synthase